MALDPVAPGIGQREARGGAGSYSAVLLERVADARDEYDMT